MRRFAGRRWIACRLEFGGRRRRPLLQPGRYTELFFLDDATALAAGHRPCAECRARRLRPPPGAVARPAPRHRPAPTRSTGSCTWSGSIRRRGGAGCPPAALEALPDGAFVRIGGEPRLVLGPELLTLDARRVHGAEAAAAGR